MNSVRLGIVAGVIVGGALTAVVAATGDDTRNAIPSYVTVTVSPPCANAQPLLIGDHAWESMNAAPPQWGHAERGTFTVTRPGEAVFRSDADGREVTFHENPSRFTMLFCGVGDAR